MTAAAYRSACAAAAVALLAAALLAAAGCTAPAPPPVPPPAPAPPPEKAQYVTEAYRETYYSVAEIAFGWGRMDATLAAGEVCHVFQEHDPVYLTDLIIFGYLDDLLWLSQPPQEMWAAHDEWKGWLRASVLAFCPEHESSLQEWPLYVDGQRIQ